MGAEFSWDTSCGKCGRSGLLRGAAVLRGPCSDQVQTGAQGHRRKAARCARPRGAELPPVFWHQLSWVLGHKSHADVFRATGSGRPGSCLLSATRRVTLLQADVSTHQSQTPPHSLTRPRNLPALRTRHPDSRCLRAAPRRAPTPPSPLSPPGSVPGGSAAIHSQGRPCPPELQ